MHARPAPVDPDAATPGILAPDTRQAPQPARAGRGQPRRGAGGAASRSALAVGYLRRSTDRQERSIPDQQRALERYAREHGLKVLDWYTDDAVSGTTSVARKAFQKLIADAQAPGRAWSAILVYDVKRFGRVGNDEAGYYRHLLRGHGVEVVYAAEGFLGAETDDLLRPVKQWRARQESKDLSKVTIRGLLSTSEGGWWLGGVFPHGYDLRYENDRGEFLFVLRHMADGGKQVLDSVGSLVRTLARGEGISTSKRDRAKLVLGEPSRVEAVRTIFRLYVQEGRGFKAIADHLNRAGVATARGPSWSHIYGGKWAMSTVRSILVNPLYAGDMVWNRRTDARFHSIVEGRAVERQAAHGARLVPNDKADWVVVRETHQGLVERGAFERTQQLLV